jgi:hypothetical protein
MTNQLKTIKVQGGKEYAEVHTRVNYFRSQPQYKNWGEETMIIKEAEDMSWVVMKTIITYPDGRIASTGHAFERQDGSKINERNHVENCETSALGRALGKLGIGSDGSIASYEEVANAIDNQNKDSKKEKEYILHTDNWAKALKFIVNQRDSGKDLEEIIKTLEDNKYGKLEINEIAEIKKAYEGK